MENYRKDLDVLCSILNQNQVEYMIVGGLAVNYHGFQRATGDIDIWYNPNEVNYEKLLKSIRNFGFETTDLEDQKYYKVKGVINLPLERFTIQFLSIIHGKFSFEDAYRQAEVFKVVEHKGKVMSYDYLIKNKIMARRPKDLEDIRQLELRNKKA
jgi:Nucleotidyl transferase of unknown function (DUF2204)